ncbi:nitrate/nitrite transporter [Polaromonas sp. CG_9.11]|uniref:MFS transporter n=1 Tax=Polaromonas sp. CG_9.11 TaxID=2787730 RepID=UPI001A256B40|nr:MFS family permease [Polaromonas sp. CG_9.11]
MTQQAPDLFQQDRLDVRAAILVFLAFAAAYFFSALLRAITATLAPVLTQEFSLQARDLGLLAGGYFLGFAAVQLPLGTWLDRHGPKRVILGFLSLAVLGCLAFSAASSFAGLLSARVLVGMGVGACLMAALTGYRRWFNAATLLRANSWMLMTGSLGMLASTLPVQWLMPLTGWRALFWVLAALILLSMAAIARLVPRWRQTDVSASVAPLPGDAGYAPIWRSRYFRKLAPLGFFNYGGMVAVQTLWAGPWMVRVTGDTPLQSATGLFCINASMLATFWGWGLVNPWLARHGWHATRLISWGVPLSLSVLAFNILAGSATGWPGWALFCMTSSVMALAQPAIGMSFKAALAGRALSAYNLVVFAGVFVAQWGLGLLIDGFAAMGLAQVASFQAAMAVYLCCAIAAYGYFVSVNADNSVQ